MLTLNKERFESIKINNKLGIKNVRENDDGTIECSVLGFIAECMDNRWEDAKKLDETPIRVSGIRNNLIYWTPKDRNERAHRLTMFGSKFSQKNVEFYTFIRLLDAEASIRDLSEQEVKDRIRDYVDNESNKKFPSLPEVCIESSSKHDDELVELALGDEISG